MWFAKSAIDNAENADMIRPLVARERNKERRKEAREQGRERKFRNLQNGSD